MFWGRNITDPASKLLHVAFLNALLHKIVEIWLQIQYIAFLPLVYRSLRWEKLHGVSFEPELCYLEHETWNMCIKSIYKVVWRWSSKQYLRTWGTSKKNFSNFSHLHIFISSEEKKFEKFFDVPCVRIYCLNDHRQTTFIIVLIYIFYVSRSKNHRSC